ncbi:MAG TPA: WYL domain-containing protein [Candidatus Anaerofilum faecale]|nr:WYL domain-containing protein [Candidatus Anaerofilum faecale]
MPRQIPRGLFVGRQRDVGQQRLVGRRVQHMQDRRLYLDLHTLSSPLLFCVQYCIISFQELPFFCARGILRETLPERSLSHAEKRGAKGQTAAPAADLVDGNRPRPPAHRAAAAGKAAGAGHHGRAKEHIQRPENTGGGIRVRHPAAGPRPPGLRAGWPQLRAARAEHAGGHGAEQPVPDSRKGRPADRKAGRAGQPLAGRTAAPPDLARRAGGEGREPAHLLHAGPAERGHPARPAGVVPVHRLDAGGPGAPPRRAALSGQPWALIFQDDNYYLVAFDAAAGRIKHFRIDRIDNAREEEAERLGRQAFEDAHPSSYAKRMFGMYGGREERVQLHCGAELVNAVRDRFGMDAVILPDPDRTGFTVQVLVSVSPQFFAWVFGFGDRMQILSPPSVREEYRARLHRTLAAQTEGEN